MRGFSDPFFIKMLRLGRDIYGWLGSSVTRLHSGYRGTFITTASVMVTSYVTWESYNKKRRLDAATTELNRTEERMMLIEASYLPHEKEFKEFLARKNKMKSEQAEGNVPQEDSFTIAGLG